ncbi:MAG TPA: winged helix DNA-binding domain-containing protein [Candidatus Limnocylindrales bacterium]|nr:winged helix DNA-binding domain-containing protein [Candidatus Limnocylindrales bacterium]
MAEPVVMMRQLRAAMLERQLLLERSDVDLVEAVERIGGLQTQYAPSGYIGLWSRLQHFQRPDLTQALEERRLVQGTLIRSTIHTVSAADYWPMTAGIRRMRRAWLLRTWGRELEGVDLEAMAEQVRHELLPGPLPMPQLTERLVAQGYPKRAVPWMGHWVDLVRVPPSGTWERRRADLYGLAETWIPPQETDEASGIELLVRRFLGAYGPAPIADVAGWVGLPMRTVRPVIEAMDLRRLRDEQGRPLVDLREGRLPDPDVPCPVRLLAVWDPILLVRNRRSGILPDDLRPRFFDTRHPQSLNAVLVGGQVVGSWRATEGRIVLSLLRELRASQRRELEAEVERLEAFHA